VWNNQPGPARFALISWKNSQTFPISGHLSLKEALNLRKKFSQQRTLDVIDEDEDKEIPGCGQPQSSRSKRATMVKKSLSYFSDTSSRSVSEDNLYTRFKNFYFYLDCIVSQHKYQNQIFETPKIMDERNVDTFPINMHKTVYWQNSSPLYSRDSDKGDQPGARPGWRIKYTLRWNAILISKGMGMRDQVWTCLVMSLTGIWKKLNIFVKVLLKQKKELELGV